MSDTVAVDTTTLLASIEAETSKLIADFKAKTAGPVSLTTVIGLLEELVTVVVTVIKPLTSPGADLSGLLTTALLEVYNKEIRPLELQHFGAIVSATVVDPMIHQAIPMLVASALKLITKV